MNVIAKLPSQCSFVCFLFCGFVQVAQLLEELVVRLPELQSIQAISCPGRQLNRRDLGSAPRHGNPDPIGLWERIELWIVKGGPGGIPVTTRSTER